MAFIVAMLTCLIVSLGRSPGHERVGFRYWKEPGAFVEYLDTGSVGMFLGFFFFFFVDLWFSPALPTPARKLLESLLRNTNS
jgi:amino acid permease